MAPIWGIASKARGSRDTYLGTAAEKLRAGDRAAPFPVGSFPPGLPFVSGDLDGSEDLQHHQHLNGRERCVPDYDLTARIDAGRRGRTAVMSLSTRKFCLPRPPGDDSGFQLVTNSH